MPHRYKWDHSDLGSAFKRHPNSSACWRFTCNIMHSVRRCVSQSNKCNRAWYRLYLLRRSSAMCLYHQCLVLAFPVLHTSVAVQSCTVSFYSSNFLRDNKSGNLVAVIEGDMPSLSLSLLIHQQLIRSAGGPYATLCA